MICVLILLTLGTLTTGTSVGQVTQRYWREDGKCGWHYRLSNGAAGQCDPDGHRPCCSFYSDCSGTAESCSCTYCTDYTRIYREWEESGGTQKWRYDGRCGIYFPLPDGTPGQCDPDGDKPCCDEYGECGSGETYCSCKDCVNYTPKRWRDDGKCGDRYTYLDTYFDKYFDIRLLYPLSDGAIAQCDPDGENPCCGGNGKCGNTPEHCHCLNCIDYRPKKWRDDGRCGKDFPLPDGKPSQCDPDSWKPCCGRDGRCGAGLFYCLCNNCVSYLRRRWRSDGRCGDPRDKIGYYSHFRSLALDGAAAECNPFGEHPYCDSERCSEECSSKDCIDYRIPTLNIENKTCYNHSSPDSDFYITSSEHKNYELNRFRCHNGRCINYNQLCDRVDDCGDRSDEQDCPNYIICNYTKFANPKFVHVTKVCDGIIDCFDMSDECNSSCGSPGILGSWVLKITCSVMGILALVFNCASLLHGLSSTINNCPTEKMMLTKVLMTLIGSGDFLIGVYLIVLSIYDSLVYGSSYCEHQPEWLTGTPCMILGVISTVGSQLSLFSMTTLSCIIMYGVVFKEMTIPSPVSRKSKIKAASLALTIQFASIAITVTPLIPALEDFFVQGMYYETDIWLLTGFPDREYHRDIINWEGKVGKRTLYPWAWSDIRKYTDQLFSHHGDLKRRPLHFYGNDGVCLFKYFFRRDSEIYRKTEQKENHETYAKDTRNAIVGAMLIVNLICFVIIAACYIAIICKTRKSTQESGQRDNPDRLRENDAMQNRIILIIVTDFLCWVPFIIISGMHNLEYIDASTWYTPFAMTILPINSVINPLLYDKILLEFLKRKFREAGEYVTVKLGNISIRAVLNRLCRRREENAPPENDIPMEVINH